jgi:HD-like signal output (HDOD) protein
MLFVNNIQRMQQSSQAKLKVQKLKYLPPLSATATRLLGMLGDDDATLHDLAMVINQDPGLSARILGLANSAYFGQTNPVLTIEDAIIRVLGLNMVKSLAFSIAASGVFESKGCRGFDLQRYWCQSLSIAMLSRQISLAIRGEVKPDPDRIYLAGLIYDIGVLVLVHEFPEECAKVELEVERQPDRDRLVVEQEIIGIDHRQAGAWLGQRWHLPEAVVHIIAHELIREVDTESHCEAVVVNSVAAWIKDPQPTEAKLTQALPGLDRQYDLSSERLQSIKVDFLSKEEEIQMIANMLAK